MTPPTTDHPKRHKQLYRHAVTCSRCDYHGDMPWVRNENRCPGCGNVEMRRKR